MMNMKSKKILLIAVLLFSILPSTVLFGQSLPIDLGIALSAGNVTLSVSGNGSCAGISVEGKLTNNTSVEISLNVNIKDCLYLANSGSGQNMLATQVYLEGGRYYEKGLTRFITIPAKASVGIEFQAYCADFDKDNPKETESFRFSVKPSAKLSIASKISRYTEVNFDVNLTKAAQIAMWRDEGKSRNDIAKLHFIFQHNK
jgi:hypothetical protein